MTMREVTESAVYGLFDGYDPGPYFDEMLGGAQGAPPHTGRLRALLDRLDLATLNDRARDSDLELYNAGITFTVYSEGDSIDRVLPFDVIPRVIPASDWDVIERGIVQRVAAINRFLHDIHHERAIVRDGVVPADLITGNKYFRPQMQNVDLPHGTYVNVCGTDLVRDDKGIFHVLEDNARTPSGVSYVVENRHLMRRVFPELMRTLRIRPVSNYGQKLRAALAEMAPWTGEPRIVLLSPGVYNSAYFEHVFLAREMGVPLVEGRDLVVRDDTVYMRTIRGLMPVDVIYRRVDDDFLDPEAFNPESLLGVPGLMRVYARGGVAVANAVGTGVADDKAVYAYMPRIIAYYLGEEPVLGNVDTRICREPEALEYTLDNLADLVVKPVGESGGYGITVGPRASAEQIEACRRQLRADPANFISQPMVKLSVSPTLCEEGLEPRHVDLRPFAVTGESTWVLPGGLTRVALRKGSIVVNSSQGGGSKDTWIID